MRGDGPHLWWLEPLGALQRGSEPTREEGASSQALPLHKEAWGEGP